MVFRDEATYRDGQPDRVGIPRDGIDAVDRRRSHNKLKIKARVEHVFVAVKRLWGFAKVRRRGLGKNANRAFVALGLAALYLARAHLAG